MPDLKSLKLLCWSMLLLATGARGADVVVASKVFTESVILGELATQLLRHEGIQSSHQRELGGTTVLWNGMLRGDIDCYAEYTGTLRAEIFAKQSPASESALQTLLKQSRVWASPPLGFNNTYVLGMRRDVAARWTISRMSDLATRPDLRIALSNEFMDRPDGWRGAREAYALPQSKVSGMAHELAYRALAAGSIDVTDLYSTDGEIAYYDFVALEDDLGFFPAYEAVFICRADVSADVKRTLSTLGGRIDATAMTRLNSEAKLKHVSEARVAEQFAREVLGVRTNAATDNRASRLVRRTLEHLGMVATSLAAAILIALPLGILTIYAPRSGQAILAAVDMLQTVPALALLVFLIPFFGIGYAPAVFALLLYSLLPILRNTHAGLADIPGELRESAAALGLSAWARLRLVELPLASRSILAGIKTAAVINVGTATLGALIGAGGYGQPILTGIRLDDSGLILEGAIPAAALALLMQVIFGALEKHWVIAK